MAGDEEIGIPASLDIGNGISPGLHLVTLLSQDQPGGHGEFMRNGKTGCRIRFEGVDA